MKTALRLLLVAVLGWMGYERYQAHAYHRQVLAHEAAAPEPASPEVVATASGFRCDGRIYCLQMTSCAEATYFLRNCPGVKMDGDGDGVPCESQWCGRPR